MRSKKAAAGKGTVSDELGGRKPEGSADKISVSLKNRKTAKKVETKSGDHYMIVIPEVIVQVGLRVHRADRMKTLWLRASGPSPKAILNGRMP